MIRVRRYWLAMVLGLVVSGQVAAEDLDLKPCAFPDVPEVPDGATAGVEQLGAAGAAVRTYVSAMEGKLECLESLRVGLGDEITSDQSALINVAYNAGVDQLNATATRYNEAVRGYKARSASADSASTDSASTDSANTD